MMSFWSFFRAKLLSITITGETPMFGKLLRTSCTPDEICLSDTISEAAELYPNRQIGAFIETVRPPKFSIKQGNFLRSTNKNRKLSLKNARNKTFLFWNLSNTVSSSKFESDSAILMHTFFFRRCVSFENKLAKVQSLKQRQIIKNGSNNAKKMKL